MSFLLSVVVPCTMYCPFMGVAHTRTMGGGGGGEEGGGGLSPSLPRRPWHEPPAATRRCSRRRPDQPRSVGGCAPPGNREGCVRCLPQHTTLTSTSFVLKCCERVPWFTPPPPPHLSFSVCLPTCLSLSPPPPPPPPRLQIVLIFSLLWLASLCQNNTHLHTLR